VVRAGASKALKALHHKLHQTGGYRPPRNSYGKQGSNEQQCWPSENGEFRRRFQLRGPDPLRAEPRVEEQCEDYAADNRPRSI
jgi:hypothetical protein